MANSDSDRRNHTAVISEACNQSPEWNDAAARRRALSALELTLDNSSACLVEATILPNAFCLMLKHVVRFFSLRKAVSFRSRDGCENMELWSVRVEAAEAKKAEGASIFAPNHKSTESYWKVDLSPFIVVKIDVEYFGKSLATSRYNYYYNNNNNYHYYYYYSNLLRAVFSSAYEFGNADSYSCQSLPKLWRK